MSHIRKQIRDAVALKMTGLSTTGSNVLIGRTRPLGRDHDPTWLIYVTPGESGGAEASIAISEDFPKIVQRNLRLTLMGRVQQADPPDDILDQMALEAEKAMVSDRSLGGLVKDIQLASTMTRTEAVGDRHDGAIRLDYSILYLVRDNAPDQAL